MFGCLFRDPETLARQEALAKKEKMDKDDQERMMEFIERQVRSLDRYLDTDTSTVINLLELPTICYSELKQI